jgi:hypothetical protein
MVPIWGLDLARGFRRGVLVLVDMRIPMRITHSGPGRPAVLCAFLASAPAAGVPQQ